MIYGHLLLFCPYAKTHSENLSAGLEQALFYFMPWFFFKAGQFFRVKPLKQVVSDSYKRLIVPFIIFSILGHLLYCLSLYLQNDYNFIHYTFSFVKAIIFGGCSQGNQPLWFLLSLFFVRVCFSFLVNRKIPIYLIAIATLLFSCLMHELLSVRIQLAGTDIGIPKYVFTTISGMFFYSVGYLLKEKQYLGGVFLVSILIFVTISIFDFSVVGFKNDTLERGHYFVNKVDSVAGIIIINNIFKYLCKIYKFPILNYIGKNSMYFLILHFPIMTLSLILYSGREWDSFILQILFITIGTMMVIYLANRHRFIKYVFGG